MKFGYRTINHQYISWSFTGISWGFCNGVTLVTRQFLYFAKYRPDLKFKYSYKEEPKAWLKFYQRIVDKIVNGEKTEIPGFSNLAEFSSSPIKIYLQRHVAEQWAINTVDLNMLLNVHQRFGSVLDSEKIKKLKVEIDFYLKRNFYPRVVIARGLIPDPHVVMVTKLYPSSKNCINVEFFNVGTSEGGYLATNEYCEGNFMWLSPDEKYYYADAVIGNLKK